MDKIVDSDTVEGPIQTVMREEIIESIKHWRIERKRRKLYFNDLFHIHQHTFLKYMMQPVIEGKNQKTNMSVYKYKNTKMKQNWHIMKDMRNDKIMPKQQHIGNHQFHALHNGHNLGIFVIMMSLTALCYDLIYKSLWNS